MDQVDDRGNHCIVNFLNSKTTVSIRKGKKIKKMLTLFFYERL
jgi:hypothetical protein